MHVVLMGIMVVSSISYVWAMEESPQHKVTILDDCQQSPATYSETNSVQLALSYSPKGLMQQLQKSGITIQNPKSIAYASLYLGQMHCLGQLSSHDDSESTNANDALLAHRRLKYAARQSDDGLVAAWATVWLSRFYCTQGLKEQDENRKSQLLTASVSALHKVIHDHHDDETFLVAKLLLSQMAHKGIGMNTDNKYAIEQAETVANQIQYPQYAAWAQLHCGTIYTEGENGVDFDFGRAKVFLIRAKHQKHDPEVAQNAKEKLMLLHRIFCHRAYEEGKQAIASNEKCRSCDWCLRRTWGNNQRSLCYCTNVWHARRHLYGITQIDAEYASDPSIAQKITLANQGLRWLYQEEQRLNAPKKNV